MADAPIHITYAASIYQFFTWSIWGLPLMLEYMEVHTNILEA